MFLDCEGVNSSSKITVLISLSLIKYLISSNLPVPTNVFGLGLSIFCEKRLITVPPAV